MRRRLIVALCLTIVAAFQTTFAAAADVFEEVPVPGGMSAVAEAIGLDTVPDRARFAGELTRLVVTMSGRRPGGVTAVLANLAGGQADERVPVPLTTAVWSDAIFRRRVEPGQLLFAILGDPEAALLCHGLSALDDETLSYFIAHPGVLATIYQHGASAFGAFGDAVRIRDNKVVTPGGESAAGLWTAVVGEPADRPDRFLRALYSLGDGRVAYLYATIAGLDRPRAAFALGLWITDPAARTEAMRALLLAWTASYGEWRNRAQPFVRPPYDAARILLELRVEPDGQPSFPRSRAFWSQAFGAGDSPDPRGGTDAVRADAPVDAAWLIQTISATDTRQRGDRLAQLSFGQRAFAAASADALPDALAAVRALPRYRMLMLTLERMGIRSPHVFAAAVRHAARFSSLDNARAYPAVAGFQAAVALVQRLRFVRMVDTDAAERLLDRLFATPEDGGRYNGGIARWLRDDLGAVIGAKSDFEQALLAAVAGDLRAPVPRLRWEGIDYRVDLAGAERRRLEAVRERQGSSSVDLAVRLASTVDALASSTSPDDLESSVETLRYIAQSLAGWSRPSADAFPPGVDPPRIPRDAIVKAAEDLAAAAKDSRRAARVASTLGEPLDELTAATLVSFVYALDIGDPDSAALLAGDLSPRHDFGFGAKDPDVRARARWGIPRQDVAPGIPWHVDGSLLGLDVGLAPLALRRLSSNRPIEVPTLLSNEREAFAASVALMNPLDFDDATRDAIVAALDAGRRRVRDMAGDPLRADSLADEIAMDGWRRRALKWSLVRAPDDVLTLFSLGELAALGDPAHRLDLRSWGAAATTSSACLCNEAPPPGRWKALVGRPQLGLLASTVLDVNLHVAEMLKTLNVPSRLAKYVLSAAVQDYIDEVRPIHPDDWLSLVRTGQAIPPERIEDYVAAAAADGPLLVDETK